MATSHTLPPAKRRRPKLIRQLLQWTLAMLLGVLCLYLAVRDVSWQAFWQEIMQIRVVPLIWGFLAIVATHLWRAKRWGTLLSKIMHLSFGQLFLINSIGFLLIHILPFRLGEFARPALLKRQHGISMSTSMATVIVERVLDGLVVTGMLVVGLLAMSRDEMADRETAISLNAMLCVSLAIFLPMVIGFFLMLWQRVWTLNLVAWSSSWMGASVQKRMVAMAENFMVGLSALPDRRSLGVLAIDSMIVWGTSALAYAYVLQAFSLSLGWPAPLLAMGMSALGVMLPGPPGFVGTYQFFVQAALLLFGVSKAVGFAYAMVFYVIHLFYVAAAGVVSLWYMSTSVSAVVAQTRQPSLENDRTANS